MYASCFYRNPRKLFIIVKPINCGVWKGERKPWNAKLEVCAFTELPAFTLMQTSQQSGRLYHSGDNGPTKCICPAFLIFPLVPVPKKIYCKFDNGIFFNEFHTLSGMPQEQPRKLFRISQSLTLFGLLMCDEHFGQIRKNMIHPDTLLIHLNEGNTRKTKPWVFGLQRFAQFSHPVTTAVNEAIPPINGK